MTASSVLVLYSLVVFIFTADATLVSKCKFGTDHSPELVEIPGCDSEPCAFYLNEHNAMTMKFRSPRYLENFRPMALAIALGVNVTYPLGQDDGCVGVTNTPCPLAENEYIEYTYSMYILPIFPKISFTIEFSLIDKDQDDEQVECFRLDVELKDR
ncbi:NPC intracellular cholesterol transporter 2 homolog a [Tribolium castaneum]|uniref:Protein NPC2 homolog-like Protein n=1 Tax=Tribolium castaneum TaxID=7070 RepID=A0A139WI11_TRICA|nr:PREDICTED: protein NPC2 homolog isoform X1 [Tribolium castaneum]KYB27613.1 Protein NPC2 homolog-like Protein [Tribolium castaneum]|eukprot:XP_015835459.1 PREDICTED: protein NPC2 homolog isoform X1 [Tribolium castaneum]